MKALLLALSLLGLVATVDAFAQPIPPPKASKEKGKTRTYQVSLWGLTIR